MVIARALTLALIACAVLVGCGGSAEQAQALCSALDADRQTDPLLLAHEAYDFVPGSGQSATEVLFEEAQGIRDTCAERHTSVARYLSEVAAFNAAVDSAPEPPPGYGGR